MKYFFPVVHDWCTRYWQFSLWATIASWWSRPTCYSWIYPYKSTQLLGIFKYIQHIIPSICFITTQKIQNLYSWITQGSKCHHESCAIFCLCIMWSLSSWCELPTLVNHTARMWAHAAPNSKARPQDPSAAIAAATKATGWRWEAKHLPWADS